MGTLVKLAEATCASLTCTMHLFTPDFTIGLGLPALCEKHFFLSFPQPAENI